MISIPSILSAGIKRFIPGVLLFLFGALVLSASMKDMTLGPAQILGFLQLGLSMFAGYVAGLTTVRKRIARTAYLNGPRSVLAGFAATFVLLVADMVHGSPLARPLNGVFAFAAGAAVSILLFSPWMTTRARSDAQAEDLDILEGAGAVLADRAPRRDSRRNRQTPGTPRQVAPIRAD